MKTSFSILQSLLVGFLAQQTFASDTSSNQSSSFVQLNNWHGLVLVCLIVLAVCLFLLFCYKRYKASVSKDEITRSDTQISLEFDDLQSSDEVIVKANEIENFTITMDVNLSISDLKSSTQRSDSGMNETSKKAHQLDFLTKSPSVASTIWTPPCLRADMLPISPSNLSPATTKMTSEKMSPSNNVEIQEASF